MRKIDLKRILGQFTVTLRASGVKQGSKLFIEFKKTTRLLGRFAPIFYFNCKYVLIVNIEKQRRKKFADFIKKTRIFKILKFFTKIKKNF